MRDYGTGSWEGGDPDCDHKRVERTMHAGRQGNAYGTPPGAGRMGDEYYADVCGKCGATRVDRQLGLEPTPEQYVANIVAVFREVRRVLAAHGTCWVNLGDSYAAGQSSWAKWDGPKQQTQTERRTRVHPTKPKDLVGIPWRVAFALQADGWYLRSDIVWSKPNPMPESVTDRPTKAHEMIFLLSKAPWTGPEPGQFGDISDEDARWLALLFDTEGNIVIKRAKNGERLQYGAQMAFANTSRALLERARDIVGAGSLHERVGKNAPVFYWQMTGRQARDLLHRIYPFLIVKHRQARVAIYMQDVIAKPKKRPGGYRTAEHGAFLERCWQTVKALNRFGNPDLSWVPDPRYGKWGATRYFFDQEAVREKYLDGPGLNGGAYSPPGQSPHGNARGPDGRRVTSVHGADGSIQHRDGERWPNGGRNIRSVWEISTQPYSEAHFATYPEALVERCLKAGCPEWVCSVCGRARERIVDVESSWRSRAENGAVRGNLAPEGLVGAGTQRAVHGAGVSHDLDSRRREVLGWSDCGHCNYRPGIVLDPFMGSGTTALVARRLGRHAIGIELNDDYAALCAKRLQQLSLLAEGTA